jgi:hypothetical protein
MSMNNSSPCKIIDFLLETGMDARETTVEVDGFDLATNSSVKHCWWMTQNESILASGF